MDDLELKPKNDAQPQQVTVVPPRNRNRGCTCLLLTLGFFAVLLSLCGVMVVGLVSTMDEGDFIDFFDLEDGVFADFVDFVLGDITENASGFMNGLVNENYDSAYGYMTDALQREIGSAADLRALMSELNVISDFTMNNINTQNNNTGTIGGQINRRNGSTLSYALEMRNIDGEWLVNGFDFQVISR